MAYDLTASTAVTYGTTAPLLEGAQYMAGGSARTTTTGAFASHTDWTVDVTVKKSHAGDTFVAFHQPGICWIGTFGDNKAFAQLGTGGSAVNITTTTAILDGAKHTLRLAATAAGGAVLLVDGVVAGSTATTPAAAGCVAGALSNNLQVGELGAGFYWLAGGGGLDELAVWDSGLTSAYTPGPISNGAAGLRAVWHMEGDLTDSKAAVTSPVISTPVQTLTAVNRTTAGATIDSGGTTGTMYALARTGGSAALSGPIISGGQSNATTGTGAKTVPNTVLAAGTANQYVDLVYVDAANGTSNVVTVGPITTASALSFSGTIGTQTVTSGDVVDIDLSSYWSGTGFGSLAYSSISASIAGTGLSINSSGHLVGTAGAATSISGVQFRKADSGSPVSQADSNTFTLTITSGGGGDTTDPTLGGSITIGTVTSSSIQASWSAGADNVAVTSYEVSSNGGGSYTDVGNVLTYNFAGLTPSTSYSLRVRAKDAAGNVSTPLSATQSTSAAPAGISGTFTLPGAADRADKQEVTLHSIQALTALTVNGNGATVNGAPASLAANGFFRLRFDAQSVAWYRVG